MAHPIKLLLVEDSADDAELLLFELEREGFQLDWERVYSKSTLKKALKKRDWDIVISDYSMQGFNGMEALLILRQHSPIIPFVLVSGAVGELIAIELMKAGGQDYVLKNNMMRLPIVIARELEESKVKKKALQDAQELDKNIQRLKLIYESTTDWMNLIRVEGEQLIIESVNPAFLSGLEELGVDTEKENFNEMFLSYFYVGLLGMDENQMYAKMEKYHHVIKTRSSQKIVEEFLIQGKKVYFNKQLTPIIQQGKCTHILRVMHDITESITFTQELEKAYKEVGRLKNILEHENNYLKEEIKLDHNFGEIASESKKIKAVLKNVEQVAPLDSTVLILGETGTGKELIARYLHELSQRKDQPMIKVNCAALPRELIESELFGHKAGAFTGATQQKEGKFELAKGGSIFLDEIGEMPIELQPKLLRVLQEGEFERIGGTQTIKLNARIIAATNQNLQKAIEEGRFREDLFYRLNVFPIEIPPLRERTEDIIPIFQSFLNRYSKKFNKTVDHVPESTLMLLRNYSWPGNVRELENMVERALILTKDGQLPIHELMRMVDKDIEEDSIHKISELAEVEKKHILFILESTKWKINGDQGAAKILGLKPSTLRDRMRKYGISRPENPA